MQGNMSHRKTPYGFEKRNCDFTSSHPITFQNICIEPLCMHVARMRKPTVWETETKIVAVATYFQGTAFEFTLIFPVESGWWWIIIQAVNSDHRDPPYDGVHIGGYFYIYHTNGNHSDRIVILSVCVYMCVCECHMTQLLYLLVNPHVFFVFYI